MQAMHVRDTSRVRDSAIGRWATRLAAIAAFTLASSCTVMETSYVAVTPLGRCESQLGSYNLPKTHIRIQVSGTTMDPKTARTALTLLEEVTVPDAERVYCLDHLASGLASDDIKVFRGDPPAAVRPVRSLRTSTQLLSFVASNSIDYTADIFRRIVRTIFIALSGKPDFTPISRSLRPSDTITLGTNILADYSFDPFDLAETERVNRDLRPLGFCILLEGSGIDPALNGEKLCGQPQRIMQEGARFAAAYAEYLHAPDLPATVPGIVYRPRQPYRLFIYAKDDPFGPGPWHLVRTMKAMLENASPVVSVGVERAIFSARRTALLFDRGTLVGMCVSKKSELLAAVEIPLEVVRSIVALPNQIFLLRIDQVTKTNNLVAAETQLINLQKQYLAFLANSTASPPSAGVSQDTTNNNVKQTLTDPVFTPPFADDNTRQATDFTNFADVCAAPTRGTTTTATTGGASQ